MKNKKMILFILGLLILVIVLGVCLLKDEAKNYDKTDDPAAVSDTLDGNEHILAPDEEPRVDKTVGQQPVRRPGGEAAGAYLFFGEYEPPGSGPMRASALQAFFL